MCRLSSLPWLSMKAQVLPSGLPMQTSPNCMLWLGFWCAAVTSRSCRSHSMRYVNCKVYSCSVELPLQGTDPLPNPFADPELSHPLPNDLHNWLYERIKYVHMGGSACSGSRYLMLLSSTQQSITFTKKIIEDNSTMDETVQFLSVSVHNVH